MYYVCLYLHRQKWWKRHDEAYPTFDKAYAARMNFISDSEVDPYLVGNKVAVWTAQAWAKLSCGYKHPDDRKDIEIHPRDKDRGEEIVKDFSELESSLAQRLREAGL